jgi:hypothetical protein
MSDALGTAVGSESPSPRAAAVRSRGSRWIALYAHLSRIDVRSGDWVQRGETIGAVGTTGNAAGKPPHLHYVIATLMPYPWRATDEPQGWRKMFFLDPSAELRQ